MISVGLPDGSTRSLPQGATGLDLAKDIGPGLAKAALAVRLDDRLEDLDYPLLDGANVAIVTERDEDDALELIRHDAAHILAMAAKELYPHIQVTIGPTVKDGFFYDFHCQEPLTPEHLDAIEKRMHEIVDRDEQITRGEWSRDEAISFYKERNEPFKIELVEAIPAHETVSYYAQGSFIDLCRGPHLVSTKKAGHAFKLMKVAGAYWRGDSNNPMLQRIYGTAFATEADLQAYLTMLEEAEKRDHRKLGKALDLFHMQEEATGSIFWHPNGWTLYREIENYVRRRLAAENYQEVKTPQMIDRSLWEASGHWEKFGENMFTANTQDDKTLALKPMNCPGHVQIYRQGVTSYRDLPLRMAEFGSCHRNEPSGALHGIMRVRAFTQDDAHIFCTGDQIYDVCNETALLIERVYKRFGFEKIKYNISTKPEKSIGTKENWDNAENQLK
ncbi:MAG TPA: threonine--tRNA ligase, partial [Alphaproteobacteria bacterium]|nr:threonine--tRNA ligase [Alphaproteobacteria bacterium]